MSLRVQLSPFDGRIRLALGITVIVISLAVAGLGEEIIVLTSLVNIQLVALMCIIDPLVHNVFRYVSSTRAAAATMVGCFKSSHCHGNVLQGQDQVNLPSYETWNEDTKIAIRAVSRFKLCSHRYNHWRGRFHKVLRKLLSTLGSGTHYL